MTLVAQRVNKNTKFMFTKIGWLLFLLSIGCFRSDRQEKFQTNTSEETPYKTQKHINQKHCMGWFLLRRFVDPLRE